MTAERPLIVAVPDSFKGSCAAPDVARAMIAGARAVWGSGADYAAVPLADGGEGTLDALLAAWKVAARASRAHDALGRERDARFGVSADGRVAVIEAAEANGLPHVSDRPFRPLDADTFGVGELARAALDAGAEEILLCIGGSATNDGGTGLLRALGARFLDASGVEVDPGARGLARIATVDTSGIDPRARDASWRIAVDVRNPLCGPTGAAAVFGPQKGAGPRDIATIDDGLEHLAGMLAARDGRAPSDYTERPGLGAAGGIPLCGVALLDAEILPGAELVADAVGLPALLERADLVLTGEGRLDAQSLGGKVIDLVRRAVPARVPVLVIAGSVELGADACRAAGIAAFSIAQGPAELGELVVRAPERIAEVAAQLCSVFEAARR